MDQELSWDGRLEFTEIVRSALGDCNAPGKAKRCPDVYVGHLGDLQDNARPLEGRWQFAVSETAKTQRPEMPCVVLVLESPHKDEYADDFPYLPWPANGSTGARIQARARNLANLLGVNGDWGLVLLNAVPYQCSQGGEGDWRRRRDKVFARAWESGGREFFRERLQHWVREGDVLVNACTAGKSSNPKLRDRVEAALLEFGRTINVTRFRMHHPSAWMNPRLANHLLIDS